MALSVSTVTLLVRDYNEAIAFFRDTMGFKLVEDKSLGDVKRWVRVAPQGKTGTSLLLARAATPEQTAHVGRQTGGRVFLFLETDDFWNDYNNLKLAGVKFIEQPRRESYGWVVVLLDLYGNKWDLVQYIDG